MSGVTKKSRPPRTATATHGLRKTRGSRGGPLAAEGELSGGGRRRKKKGGVQPGDSAVSVFPT